MTWKREYWRSLRGRHVGGLEWLESRVLLSSTLIPITDHTNLVVDAGRNELLIVGAAGTINRYDISSGQLLTPINLGITAGGADISPDGQFLYVPSAATSSTLTLDRVRLDTGLVDTYSIPLTSGVAGLYDCAVLADGRVELTTVAPGGIQTFLKFDPNSLTFNYEQPLNTNGFLTHEAASIFRSADRQSAIFMEPQNSSISGAFHDPGGIRLFHTAPDTETQLESGTLAITAATTAALNRDGTLYAVDMANGIELFNQSGALLSTLTGIHGGLAFSPVDNRLYVADPNADAIFVADTSTPAQPSIQSQLALGEDLAGVSNFGNGQIAISPDGSQLFVTTASGIRQVDQPAHAWATTLVLQTPASLPFEQAPTLTATISSDDPMSGALVPSGTVWFYADSGGHLSLLGSSPVVNGTASLTPNVFSLGHYTLSATYGGDENFSFNDASNALPFDVTKITPQMSMSITFYSTSIVQVGDAFSIQTNLLSNVVNPSGTVALWNTTINQSLGTMTLSNGAVQTNVGGLPVGSYTFRADYSGATIFTTASAFLTVSVIKASTSVTLPALVGDSDILTAQITSSANPLLTGNVTLLDNGTPVLTAPVSNRAAQFDVSALSSGPHVFAAVYSGDSSFESGSSSTLSQVLKLATATHLVAQKSSLTMGQLDQLTATVSPAVAGYFTFFDNGLPIGTVLANEGAATWNFSPTVAGGHTLSVEFDPAGYYRTTSDSSPVTVYQPTVLDLLALYTPKELVADGSLAAILAKLQQQIADTNQAFANSQIPLSVRLVALTAENYKESGKMDTDWRHLANPSDGSMDNVTALRDQVGADLVVLLDSASTVDAHGGTETEGEGSELTSSFFNAPFQSEAAFIVISEAAPETDYTLAHEIGHTLGAAHAVGDPGGDGLYADAHGYRFTGNNSVVYHDIMAYYPGTAIPYYSNPDVTYQGVAEGQAGSANVAHVIRATALSVAAYRSALPFGAITQADATSISGWAIDGKALQDSSTIRIDIDGVQVATMPAALGRADLLASYGASNHGFTYVLPRLAAGKHVVNVYALDSASGQPVFIGSTTVQADHFVWQQQPRTMVAGLPASLTLAVKNVHGQIDTSYQATLTVSIASGPDAGVLAGSAHTATFINGLASFPNLVLQTAGNYTLSVTDGSLILQTSTISVMPDAGSTHLVMLSGTAPAVVGKAIGPLVVAAEDQFGNVVTTANSKVTLGITSIPPGGTMTGTQLLALSKGIAKFTNVALTQAGAYQFTFSDTALAVTTPVQWSQSIIQAATSAQAPHIAASYTARQGLSLTSVLSSTAPVTVLFTGTVTLTDQADHVLGTAILAPGATGGQIKWNFIAPDPGTYSCQVHYFGDNNHSPATSSAFTLVVNPVRTTTTLEPMAGKWVFGQSLTLTANVQATLAGATPTGNVSFYDGTTQLNSAPLAGDATASLTITPSTVGTHRYKAIYSGDTLFAASTASPLSSVIAKDKTTIALALASSAPSPPNPLTHGQAVDLTVRVAVVAPGASVLLGDPVTIKDGSKVLGTVSLDAGGNATLAGITFTKLGVHNLTATYAGDINSSMVTSSVLKLTVV